MNGLGRVVGAVLLVLAAGLATGCTTLVSSRTAAIPRGAPTAVLMVDEAGHAATPGFAKNYLYDAVMAAGLRPIVLNEANVAPLLASLEVTLNQPEGSQTPVTAPPMLKALLAQLDGITHLIILQVWASALDEDMRALVVDVQAQQIIAVHHYRHRAMATLWATLTPAFGAGLLIVPWFYLSDDAASEHAMFSEFLQSVMEAPALPPQPMPPYAPPAEAAPQLPAPPAPPPAPPAPAPAPAPASTR